MKAGPFLMYFDKLLLLIAIAGAAATMFFVLQPPEGVWHSIKATEEIDRLKEHQQQDSHAKDIPYTFEKNYKRFSESLNVRSTPFPPGEWSFYQSPTPRPFAKITATPITALNPIIGPVSDFTVVSTPGKVELKWGAPEKLKDARLEAYFLFRTASDKPFGFFTLGGKLKITLGKGTQLEKPFAGPLKTTSFIDNTITPEKGYSYMIVAVGYPARIITKDGKPVTDANGNPVYEDTSTKPIASVSWIVSGETVPEYQIFLTGELNGVAANFEVHKWLRDEKRWLKCTPSISNIVIGNVVSKKVKIKGLEVEFDTGYYLDTIDSEEIEVNGRKRTVTYALLIKIGEKKRTKKVYLLGNRTLKELKSEFGLVTGG